MCEAYAKVGDKLMSVGREKLGVQKQELVASLLPV